MNRLPGNFVTVAFVLTLSACGGGGGSSGGGSTPPSRPVATGASVSVDEDNLLTMTLQGTASNGGTLSFNIVSTPSHGQIALSGAQLQYLPDTNFNGSDSFGFISVENGVFSTTATVSITVNPVNDAPTANGTSITTNEDEAISGQLTGTDVEGSALTYTITRQPAAGTVVLSGASYTYTPNANVNDDYFSSGQESFLFTVSDGELTSPQAAVSISITPVNDAPELTVQDQSAVADATYNLTTQAQDVDGDTLTYQGSSSADGVVLSYSNSASAEATLTVPNGVWGEQDLSITVTDSQNASTVANFVLDVTVPQTQSASGSLQLSANTFANGRKIISTDSNLFIAGFTDEEFVSGDAFVTGLARFIVKLDLNGNYIDAVYLPVETDEKSLDMELGFENGQLQLVEVVPRSGNLYARISRFDTDLQTVASAEPQLPFSLSRSNKYASVKYVSGQGFALLANDNQLHFVSVDGALSTPISPQSALADDVHKYVVQDARLVDGEWVMSVNIWACTDDPLVCSTGENTGLVSVTADSSASEYQVQRLFSKFPNDSAVLSDGKIIGFKFDANSELVMFNPDASIAWNKVLGGYIGSVGVDANDTVYMQALSNSDGVADSASLLSIRAKSDGDLVWQNDVTVAVDAALFARDLLVDGVGNSYYPITFSNGSINKYAVIKVDYSGQWQWMEVNSAVSPASPTFEWGTPSILVNDNQIFSVGGNANTGFVLRTLISPATP